MGKWMLGWMERSQTEKERMEAHIKDTHTHKTSKGLSDTGTGIASEWCEGFFYEKRMKNCSL